MSYVHFLRSLSPTPGTDPSSTGSRLVTLGCILGLIPPTPAIHLRTFSLCQQDMRHGMCGHCTMGQTVIIFKELLESLLFYKYEYNHVLKEYEMYWHRALPIGFSKMCFCFSHKIRKLNISCYPFSTPICGDCSSDKSKVDNSVRKFKWWWV